MAGNGAVAFVHLRDTGLRFDASSADLLRYEAAAHVLLLVRGTRITSYSTQRASDPAQVVEAGEGSAISAVRASPDGSMLALQRSPSHIQFVQTGSTNVFVQGPWKGKETVMGFFWAKAADCDFVIVTKAGLEIYTLLGTRQGLRHSTRCSHPVKWWMYSHDTRICLLGTGDIGLWLQAYQFTHEAIVKLPPFQIGASTPGASSAPPAQSRLDPSDVVLLNLYSRAYCAYVDRPNKKLHLYLFFKDAIVPQQQYSLPGTRVRLCTEDNLLLVHHPSTATVLVIDVRGNGRCTFSSPLVFLSTTGEPPLPESRGAGATSPPAEGAAVQAPAAVQPVTNSQTWRFELPNLILDLASGRGWQTKVDLEALVKSSRELPDLVALLQRRRPAAHPSTDLKSLTLSLVKGVLVERMPVTAVRSVLDCINAAYGESLAVSVSADAAGRPASSRSSSVLSPEEVGSQIFQWLHDEEAVDAQYLQAAIAQEMASADAWHLEVPHSLHILAFDVALQLGHAYQVALTVGSQAGVMGSAALAERLDTLAGSGGLVGGRQLANDVRARTGEHEARCRALLRQGQVLRALRCAVRHQVVSLAPAAFMHAAAETGDMGIFTAVYRLCWETVRPQPPEYSEALKEYSRLLQPSGPKA